MMKAICTALLATAGIAHAGDMSLSGFATVAAGRAYSGDSGSFMEYRCPCYVANFEHGSVYQGGAWSLAKESLLGVQGKYQLTADLSATVQAVTRASENGKAKVDWAYLSYRITPETTLQGGRRRLPIYAYSDSVYVGYTLPWVRVPQDIYGWQVGAYNGVNVTHKTSAGDWAVMGNVFAGQEHSSDNLEQRRIYYGHRVDEDWKHIVGGFVEVSNDALSARLVYMQNTIDQTLYRPGEPATEVLGKRQRVLGLSANAMIDDWQLRLEANRFVQPALDFSSRSWTVSLERRWRDLTVLAGYSAYKEKWTPAYTTAQVNNTRFLALRWDFRPNMDLKLQFDAIKDSSTYSFTHDAKLVSAALDFIF